MRVILLAVIVGGLPWAVWALVYRRGRRHGVTPINGAIACGAGIALGLVWEFAFFAGAAGMAADLILKAMGVGFAFFALWRGHRAAGRIAERFD